MLIYGRNPAKYSPEPMRIVAVGPAKIVKMMNLG